MDKFEVTKRMSLDFLGTQWKKEKCYLEFNELTIKDLTGDFSKMGGVDPEDQASVIAGLESSNTLIKDRFVRGLGISGGKAVKITKDDIEKLPAKVLMRAIAFLSQELAPEEEKQS